MNNTTLAREINEFVKSIDSYEYNDIVDDELQFIMEIYDAIINNDTEDIIKYLKDFIEEDGQEEDVLKAKELLNELIKNRIWRRILWNLCRW